eukprot:scaffold92704_cov59-Phaeocystis_antarctica.AAC.7
MQQWNREAAEREARGAAQSGDKYYELLAKGMRHASKLDPRRAAKAYREAIALDPANPLAYFNLGNALASSEHTVEAAKRALGKGNGRGLQHAAGGCGEVAKPEWWNDQGLKALSARVVRAAPNEAAANQLRAEVLSRLCDAWEAGPRTAAELKEAAARYERTAALSNAPAQKASLAVDAAICRTLADAM